MALEQLNPFIGAEFLQYPIVDQYDVPDVQITSNDADEVDGSDDESRDEEGQGNNFFEVVRNRVAKCDVIILQIFTFKPQNHIKQCTQQLRECVQNFKSLAILKVKIEPFKVPYSPILNSLILLWFQMKYEPTLNKRV